MAEIIVEPNVRRRRGRQPLSSKKKAAALFRVWHTVRELIEQAEHAGANSILLNVNLGALPNDLFMEQVRRIGKDVLPKLQAHQVKKVRQKIPA